MSQNGVVGPSHDDAAPSTPLAPDVVLQARRPLEVRLGPEGDVEVATPAGWVSCGRHGLEVISRFTTPSTLGEVLDAIPADGLEEWMAVSAAIVALHRNGVLTEPGQAAPVALDAGFGSPEIHIAMLNDRVRTDGFRAGLREVVRPGDVVLDIGTGTGILAVAAAQAGAAHVYAIEAGRMADVAEQTFAAAGLAERITLIRGWSFDVSLPARADVLVTETIGNDPLDEAIVPIVRDARARLLRPGARVLPSHLEVGAVGLEAPEALTSRRFVSDEAVADWRAWYGVDLSAFQRDSLRAPARRMVRTRELVGWRRLTSTAAILELDLEGAPQVDARFAAALSVSESGRLDGVALTFKATLGTRRLATDPDVVSLKNSWRYAVWLLPAALAVEAGDRIRITGEIDERTGVERLMASRAT